MYLDKKVLKIPLDAFDFKHARIGKRLPVVFSRAEAQDVISNLHAEFHLMASLLYGSGLRLTECLKLCVKDIDFNSMKLLFVLAKGIMTGELYFHVC